MMSQEAWTASPAATATCVAILTTVTIMTTTVTATAQNAAPDQPDQIEWDLSEIYPTLEAWDTARGQLATRVEGLAAYRGTRSTPSAGRRRSCRGSTYLRF